MKIGIDFGYFKKKADVFNRLSVVVTVGDQDNKFYRRPTSTVITQKWGKTRVASRKRRVPTIKIKEITAILDADRGLYSKAIKKSKNTDLINLADSFASLYLSENITKNDEKRLENLSSAIVRNNLTYHRFGKNKRSTIRKKGFDSWGIDTGQTIKSIKGFYRG